MFGRVPGWIRFAAMTAGESSAHVAELLRGGWQRSWIRYSDGALDDTSTVVWLQHESAMADVRVP